MPATVSRDDLEQLFATYAWALDTHDHALLGEVFSPDARLSYETPTGEHHGPWQGREAILGRFAETHSKLTEQRRHFITNIRIAGEGAGDSTVVTAYITILGAPDGKLVPRSSGYHRCEVAYEDGVPRVVSQHSTFNALGL